jgi:predicted glutamine amidotransferase
MCRWLAYSGSPILMKDVLYRGTNSLVDQSLHSRLGAEPTNGDGFGVGWYGAPDTPGVFRSVEPAWNDENLRELAGHISSPLFFTHIRAAIGSAVQQTNCHPFRHENWLFMHNGYINEFAAIKRDLILAVDPSLYPEIKGQADTEVLFYLALTFGLQDAPRPPSGRRSGSSKRSPGATGCRTPSRARSRPPMARASGRSATRASISRARCSTPPTSPRCASGIPTGKSSESSQTTRG